MQFEKFLSGFECFCSGISDFFKDRSLWKYALIPAVLMLVAYTVAAYCIFLLCRMLISAEPGKSPEWMQNLTVFASGFGILILILLTMIVFVLTAAGIYEIFAGPFFDPMLREYMQKKGKFPQTQVKTGREWLMLLDSVSYSIKTCFWMAVLLPASVFIPVAGPFLFFVFMAWRMGVTYTIPAGFQQDMRLKKQLMLAKKNRLLLLGFGTASYILISIPLLPVLLLPGVILGGVKVLEKITKTENSTTAVPR